MKSKLKDTEWKWLEEKYGNLLHHIAYRVGGDKVTNDHDDTYQELSIAMMDTVIRFDKSMSVPFAEYKDTIHFDKYLKTVLWNRKNCLGQKIKKREPLRRQFTIDEQLVKEKAHTLKESFEPFGNEDLDADLRELIYQVEMDNRIIKPSGGLNINRLCENMGKTKSEVNYVISRLKNSLKDYIDYEDTNGESEIARCPMNIKKEVEDYESR
jgi:hypothetical protein